MNEKGFSLVELLTVVGILGVLAAIAIPSYVNFQHMTRAKLAVAMIKQIEEGFLTCYREREFSPYKEGSTLVTTADCLQAPASPDLPPNVTLTNNKDSGNTKGCFSVEIDGAKDDKEGIQCVDFLLTGKGRKNNHYKDDGTKDGTCSGGVCQ